MLPEITPVDARRNTAVLFPLAGSVRLCATRCVAEEEAEDGALDPGDDDDVGNDGAADAHKGLYADIGGWVEATYEVEDRDIEGSWDDGDDEPTNVYDHDLEPTAVYAR